ncbi:hypothetical protein C7P94_14460 [Staphylococcus aureus]|nr:hypothetical protein C7P94_14460 [Staphylococcus aureus]
MNDELLYYRNSNHREQHRVDSRHRKMCRRDRIVYIKTKDSLQLTIFILNIALIILYCAPLLFIYVF